MRLSPGRFKNRKGTVVIFVLFVIAFASSIIVTMSEESVKNYEEVNDVYLMNQSYIYAKTAVKIVENLMSEDDFTTDTRNDDWYNIPMYPLDNGYISLKITPANSKININDIDNSDDEIAKRITDAWNTAANDYELIEWPANIIKDWIDNDTEISQNGLEMEEYSYMGKTFNTKDGPLDTLAELNLLNSEVYTKMKNLFTVKSASKQININFTSAETLKYYFPELEFYAEDIINYRNYNEYTDISQIREAASIPDDLYIDLVPFLSVKSTYFYVKININLAEKNFYYHALLKRNQNNVTVGNFFKGSAKDYY